LCSRPRGARCRQCTSRHRPTVCFGSVSIQSPPASSESHGKTSSVGIKTHVFPNNSSKARKPQQTRATDLVNPQPFAAEHGLAQPLALVVLDDILRRGQVSVVAHAPGLAAGQSQARDVAERVRGQQQLSGARKGGLAHLAAGHELL